MDRDNREEFMDVTVKSCKRHRNDQDPPLPPPKDSEQSKKKRYDYEVSASQQPQAQTSSAKKTTNTKDAPSSSSKQKSAPPNVQHVDDIPVPDVEHISDLVDTGVAPLLKIQTRPDWQIAKSKLSKADLEGPAFKDLEYLISGDKDKRHALSISKLKAVTTKPLGSKNSYHHCGLKVNMNTLLVQPTVSHTGGLRARNSTSQDTVPPLIIISKADFKILHSNDFEDLYLLHLQGNLNHLSGVNKVHLFNAVNLLIRNLFIRKRVEDLQLEIESYQTKLNLTQPKWNASDFLFKEDYTIFQKSMVVMYRDRNDQKKMMRENE
nr:hypothetical protein [Tanacetum cinerariifolium]